MAEGTSQFMSAAEQAVGEAFSNLDILKRCVSFAVVEIAYNNLEDNRGSQFYALIDAEKNRVIGVLIKFSNGRLNLVEYKSPFLLAYSNETEADTFHVTKPYQSSHGYYRRVLEYEGISLEDKLIGRVRYGNQVVVQGSPFSLDIAIDTESHNKYNQINVTTCLNAPITQIIPSPLVNTPGLLIQTSVDADVPVKTIMIFLAVRNYEFFVHKLLVKPQLKQCDGTQQSVTKVIEQMCLASLSQQGLPVRLLPPVQSFQPLPASTTFHQQNRFPPRPRLLLRHGADMIQASVLGRGGNVQQFPRPFAPRQPQMPFVPILPPQQAAGKAKHPPPGLNIPQQPVGVEVAQSSLQPNPWLSQSAINDVLQIQNVRIRKVAFCIETNTHFFAVKDEYCQGRTILYIEAKYGTNNRAYLKNMATHGTVFYVKPLFSRNASSLYMNEKLVGRDTLAGILNDLDQLVMHVCGPPTSVYYPGSDISIASIRQDSSDMHQSARLRIFQQGMSAEHRALLMMKAIRLTHLDFKLHLLEVPCFDQLQDVYEELRK